MADAKSLEQYLGDRMMERWAKAFPVVVTPLEPIKQVGFDIKLSDPIPDPGAGPCGKLALLCGTCSVECAEKRAVLRRELGVAPAEVDRELAEALAKLQAEETELRLRTEH